MLRPPPLTVEPFPMFCVLIFNVTSSVPLDPPNKVPSKVNKFPFTYPEPIVTILTVDKLPVLKTKLNVAPLPKPEDVDDGDIELNVPFNVLPKYV